MYMKGFSSIKKLSAKAIIIAQDDLSIVENKNYCLLQMITIAASQKKNFRFEPD